MPAPAVTSEAAIVASARRLLEERGAAALTMRAIATEVGVKSPSLYKRVRDRYHVMGLVLDQVTDELTDLLEAAASAGDGMTDLRAMTSAYRRFARANPAAYGLMFNSDPLIAGSEARSRRSSTTLLARMEALTGADDALPAARMLVAWAHGFITMELAGAFRLGGDVDAAWDFGLTRILTALAAD
ncbi:TetR family transcriptional regulator [Kribbella sp. VKM Ac-2571]|uniref:TetR/AcrR family transcriptional regulator n=1 Tax=Kribbella sp. VKM Ac-2571 TaxID=2512222 RepID=UPI00105BF5CB|nr:TetR/AcrR family transcriptional regulator [Kribbella sp. VKM Ac-2571]TDO66856.1 TetR family transcriptional regulator [Kribbella sp. VKM Ac-2571]